MNNTYRKTIPCTLTGVLLAYRYLDTEYESNQFKWDVSQSGFGIGLGFRW